MVIHWWTQMLSWDTSHTATNAVDALRHLVELSGDEGSHVIANQTPTTALPLHNGSMGEVGKVSEGDALSVVHPYAYRPECGTRKNEEKFLRGSRYHSSISLVSEAPLILG